MAKKKEQKGSGFSSELQEALNALNATYGDGSLSLINEAPNMTVETIPTGSLILDRALNGGWPKGRVIEIYGDESTAKSTLCWHFLSQIPGPKLYVDTEQSLDKSYGERIGCDLSNLIINQCETLEEGLTIVRELCDKVDGIVFDSVTEAATQRELDGSLTDQDIGVKAKIMSKMLRLIKAKEHDSTILFISQVRENPGITYGSNRVVSGGKALKFGAHVRLDLYGKEIIKGKDDVPLGHRVKIKIVKSKSSTPHIKLEVPLYYDGRGISYEQELIDLCLEEGIITQAGSWFSHESTKLGQGNEQVRTFLISNPEFAKELENKLKQI
jgi:recombination protein RecA